MHKSFSISPVVNREAACPRCGQKSRSVSPATIGSLVTPAARARLRSLAGFQFCATPKCDVTYFHPANGETVMAAEVSVPIFQKGTGQERLVCYCFGYTVEEIQREFRTTGISQIATDIKTKCTQGLDDCAHTNPQGSCCLGNIQRVIREAAGDNQSPPSDAGSCCCQ